jgi:hypothetical protein
MKLELNESTKKFIETLSNEDLTKATITESTFESADQSVDKKFKEHIKERFNIVGEKIKLATEQFKAEHPEYFKNN